jgi:hypothetical protein
MTIPTTRDQLKEWCLRSLGAPIIRIEIDDDQLDDRIDEALQWFYDYHADGSDKCYYKYQITANDVANKYITLPNNFIGAIRIFQNFNDTATNNMFSIRYQISLNDLYTLTSVSMVPYFMTLQHLQSLEQLLVGEMPVRYNRHTQRLYIDGDWSRFTIGDYLIVEAYQIIDPAVFTDVFNDRWLKRYATALIKKQWGSQLKKLGNMTLPGGIVFNGQIIYNEAVTEIEEIEHEVIHSYSLPVSDQIF